jgi:hypothetical protein
VAAASAAAAVRSSETSIESLKARLSQPPQRAAEIDEPELEETEEETQDEAEEIATPILAGGVESVEDTHEPWTPIEESEPWSIPLQTDDPVAGITYEAAALPEPEKKTGRPRWAVPAGVAGVLILLVGVAAALNRRHTDQPAVVPIIATGPTAPVTTPAPAVATTDSAAGVIAPVALADSAEFNAIRDSIVAADVARREARLERQRAEAAAERERAAATFTDANGVKWSTVPPPPLDSVKRADSVARAKKDTTAAKKDSTKVKPDTTVKPDTGKVKPDTGSVRRQ